MTKISKKIIAWLLGAVAFMALALGVAFTRPQTKVANAATTEVVWKDAGVTISNEGDNMRFLVQTNGLQWTSYNNQSYADNYLAYTKLNGKTVKEINEEAAAAGSTGKIWACLQPAGSFSFYSVYIPKTFETLLPEDVFSLSIEPGWTHLDSSTNPNYPGTGNTYTNSTQVSWVYRDDAFQKNTGKYADFSTASYTFASQGDQKDGSTCFLFSTKDTTNYWTAYSTVFKMNNPILNAIYINGKSINAWNAEAQASVTAGTAADICYGSTNTNNTTAGAPIAVRPGFSSSASIGAFFQIYIANDFLPASEIKSVEWKAGFAFVSTGTRDVYYTSKDARFDLLGTAWKHVTEFVDFNTGNMKVEDQGSNAYSGINCFLIRFGVQEKIAGYLCLNDQYQKASLDTGLTYGENLDYITINGKTIGQIKAENPNYAYANSTHPNIKTGGSYAPIFAHISSADFGKGKENFIQVYIPNDLIDPASVTEIGLKSGLFNMNANETIKYGLTEDVTFVKENGTWGAKPVEIETEITGIHASVQNFLTFSLSHHDYANVAANTGVNKARLTASGLWDYIEVNGVTLTNDTTNESVYNIYGRATNTYSVRLNQYTNDNAEGDITSVTIKAGARFPSYAYNSTGEGTPVYYVVKEDVTFVYDSANGWHKQVAPMEYTVTFVDGNGNTFATQKVLEGEKATAPAGTPTKESAFDYQYTFLGWYVGETAFDFENTAISADTIITAKFSEVDNKTTIETDIFSVEWGLNNNNFLAFELSNHDYAGAETPLLIRGGHEMLKATNFFDKIYFDGESMRTLLKVDENTNPHLNIFTLGKFGVRVGTAGQAFPYTEIKVEAGCEFLSNAYVEGTSKTLYVTTEDLVFRTNDNGKTWYDITTEYTVTFVDGDGNVFEEQQVLVGTPAMMPVGTPTKATDDDYKYVFSAWYLGETEYDFESMAIFGDTTITAHFSTVAVTSILSVEWGVNDNNFLAFELSKHDYEAVATPKEISGGDGILKATNMLDHIYLDGMKARDIIGQNGTNPHLNIFTVGKFGFRIGTAGTEFPYQTITISAGCEFLSNAYIQGDSEALYVTARDFTFINWYGGYVEENSIPATKIVDVVRLTYQEQENWLVFTFDDIDYPKANDTFNYEIPSSYLNTLRFFDYIEVTGTIYLNHYENGTITGVDVVEKATLAEIYKYNGKPASGMINIWKQQNTFAIRVANDKDNKVSKITSITIKEGAEFPSYKAATGNTDTKVSYMVASEVQFEQRTGGDTTVFNCTTESSRGIDMWMSQGASIRLAGSDNYDTTSNYMETEGYKYSGIRFQTNISREAIAELERKLADGTYLSVSFGTLIIPSQYLMGGQFTHEWLNKNGKQYKDIPSSAGIGIGWAEETEDYVSYFGSIVSLQAKNHARNFAGLGYVLVEKADGTIEYFYAPYEMSYARSAAYIAQMAIADRAENKNDEYQYQVSENNNWSPYTNNERAFLALYFSALNESVISASDLSSALAQRGGTATVDMKQNGLAQQIGSYIHLTYSTNINILGTLVYSNKANATESECVKEEFYLQAGSGEHKQYLDLFRKNGLGYYNGTPGSYSSTRLINPNSVYLQKIIFKNVELEDGVTPEVQLVGFRSTYKTLETSDLPGNSVHLYLTREQTEDEKVASEYNEVTVGANLALGGAITYLAKSGVYEGLTSQAVQRSGNWAIKNQGQYSSGTVGMSTDTSVFKYKDPISGLYYIGGSGVGSSKPGVGVNLISNQDVGRQIQQSYYAAVGGTDDATSGENGYTRAYCYTESSSGKYWPYNPVQAGDCGNNTSQIIDYELNTEKNYIYVKTRAMDWAQAIDDRLNGLKNQKNAIRGGRTTKSYMENYYYLNADGTLKVDNSFVDWNGFTSMETCGWQSNELPATIISHNLAYYVSNTSMSANDAWQGTSNLKYTYRPESYLQTNVDGTAFDGRKYEDWYAWSVDSKGTFALGMYMPNVSSFSASVIVSSNSLSEARNANANNKGNSRVCTLWTESGTSMYYDYADIRAGWESCYVFNSSYTAPSTAYRMEEYKTMQYSYVISLNSVETIYSQFKDIHDSGALTNGGKVGEKIGLDAWARQDKVWTW